MEEIVKDKIFHLESLYLNCTHKLEMRKKQRRNEEKYEFSIIYSQVKVLGKK